VSKLKLDASNPQISWWVTPDTTLTPTFTGSLLPGEAGAIFIKLMLIDGAISCGFGIATTD
jgi:hypothetical protein